MKYQAAIFDLDGTILSSLDDLATSTNYALALNNMPQRTTDEVRQFVGNGARKLIERAVPQNTAVELIDKVQEDFNAHYKIHCNDQTRPYDGILDMLTVLREKGLKLAVLSNKPDFAVQEICAISFNGYFDMVSGEIAGIKKKPDSEGVFRVTNALGVDPQKCVYIGDSDVDILTAKNSGMTSIGVDWGFRPRQLLIDTGADMIASTPEELLEMIIK